MDFPLYDTPPGIEKLRLELVRKMPAWRRLYLAGQMTEAVRLLALSGLQHRYPRASEAELNRRLADLTLGPDLAARIYGPMAAQ